MDTCTFCERVTAEIKEYKQQMNRSKVKELQVARNTHKKKASTFYKLMKLEPPQTATYCFDLQQVQPLPKLTITE